MRSFLKLLLTLAVLGAAVQQGWLQAGTRFVAELFGANPGLVPEAGMNGLAGTQSLTPMSWSGLSASLRALPEPWHGLIVLSAGVIAVILVIALIRMVVRTTARVTGWLRDVSV